MTGRLVAAVDLGASSGRVMVGRVGTRRAGADRGPPLPQRPGPPARRAPLGHPAPLPRGAHRPARGRPAPPMAWSASASTRGRSTTACSTRRVAWSASPWHYRDARTDGVDRRPSTQVVPPGRPLRAQRASSTSPSTPSTSSPPRRAAPSFAVARADAAHPGPVRLLADRRPGGAEVTNASTTGAARRPHRRSWDHGADRPRSACRTALFPPLGAPGDVIGPLRDGRPRRRPARPARRCRHRGRLPRHGLGGRRRAGRRDAASPTSPAAPGRSSAWSWTTPVLTEASRQANFTNEGGVDGAIRFLRNVMGLWLLQESLRTWALEGSTETLPALLIAAGELPRGRTGLRPRRPGLPAARRHAGPDRRRPASDSGRRRRRPIRRWSAASSTASPRPTRRTVREAVRALRAGRRGRPPRRRRRPQHAALPAHRGRLRAARPGRTRSRRPRSATSSSRRGPAGCWPATSRRCAGWSARPRTSGASSPGRPPRARRRR